MKHCCRVLAAFAAIVFILGELTPAAVAQQLKLNPAQSMRWRLIGPFRAGRSLTAVGVPGHPSLFYFGAVGGGVWKSTDSGTSWHSIFDHEPIASIGAMAVAPSDPNVIYVGSGEADMRSDISYGDGMYKSTDGGKTWSHIGLTDTQQIGRVLVDPHDPNTVFVAALGHAYAANSERGVFRTTDGGKTWSRVLYKNDDTGAIDLAYDPQDSHIIYAALWQTRRTPWNVYPPSNGPDSGLYKSVDGGTTWTPIENGLPKEGLGRIGIAVAPTDRNRLYAIVDAKQGGLYRSDDAGKTWKLMDNERRIWGRGWYFGIVTVDPKNENVLYVANTSVYKSVDGGKSFTAFKGAPGGDDYHSIWISPDNPNCIIVSSDQGTVITENDGKTWSSWYNQPTGQFYHVVTDNRFPYWVYGAQQDSGAMAVPSRSNYAGISERDWRPISVGGESGSLAPDPLHPNIVFGGTVSRYDWKTMQSQNVSPTIGMKENFRQTWTLPLAFSMADKHKLYFSYQMLFRTENGGQSWQQISPDLARENPEVPPNLDPITAKMGLESPRKGVIYAIAPSPLDPNLVWVGTDDGLIHVTHDDGQHWQNVTPPQLTAWSKVGIIEASHFDKNTAYAAIDRHRLNDYKAYIYRTHDGGKTWQMVSRGIPDGAYANVVREDPVRRGLLFAGTELGVYVSFNDGDDWQPLQMNLPVSSVRDIAIHDNDLVIATHGRAFWILDDITALRQLDTETESEESHLFKPETALRIRPGSDQGTPFPPEIPQGENPPNGAIIDYWLKTTTSTPVVLEIVDGKGNVIRRYSSSDKPPLVNEKSLVIPMYWIKPSPVLSNRAGINRWVWDLHYAAPEGAEPSRRFGSGGPWVVPGEYTVKLIVDGRTYSQPLAVKMDPRVKTPESDLQAQLDAALRASHALAEAGAASSKATAISRQLQELQVKAKDNTEASAALKTFEINFTKIAGPAPGGYGEPSFAPNTDFSSLQYLQGTLGTVFYAVESADAAPTTEQLTALSEAGRTLTETLSSFHQMLAQDLPRLNTQLKKASLPEINVTSKKQ